METLDEFVTRFSESVGCYYHKCRSGIFSLKRVNTDNRGVQQVFAWVSELKRKAIFRVGTNRDLAELVGVSELANGEKLRQDWNKTGVFFCINKGSTDEDYQKAVRALRAIFLLNPP